MRLVNLVPCLLLMHIGYFGCFCSNLLENGSDIPPSGETTTLATSTITSHIETTETPSTQSSTSIPISTTPSPNPSSGTWSVTEGNLTCILVKLDASFVVPYNTSDGKIQNSSSFSLLKNATSKGSCFSVEDGLSQEITLSWKVNENIPDSQNSLTLVFFRNLSGIDFHLAEVKLRIFPDPAHFPNVSLVEFIEGHRRNDSLYKTSVNTSYRCNAEDVILVPVDSDNNQSAIVRLSHVQFEAFRSEEERSNTFSKAIDCPADGILTSDIVPIAVGCALAALVVVVLIAYLIGRRRARQRGYQSV